MKGREGLQPEAPACGQKLAALQTICPLRKIFRSQALEKEGLREILLPLEQPDMLPKSSEN